MNLLFLTVIFSLGMALSAHAERNYQPYFAIWREHEGSKPGSKAPYLRVAIWEDGRIVFANDPAKRGNDLKDGQLEAALIATLRELRKQLFLN